MLFATRSCRDKISEHVIVLGNKSFFRGFPLLPMRDAIPFTLDVTRPIILGPSVPRSIPYDLRGQKRERRSMKEFDCHNRGGEGLLCLSRGWESNSGVPIARAIPILISEERTPRSPRTFLRRSGARCPTDKCSCVQT
jgi:hypothetical protein